MGDAWSKAGQKEKAIGAYQLAAEGFANEGFLPRAIAASKLILELAPAPLRGTYVGVVSTAGQIGGLLAPGIVGLLVSATGSFSSGFTFMTIALCVSAIGMFTLSSFLRARSEPRALRSRRSMHGYF